jgi:dTDP-4-amino-4,6-dideoxygalactose transaminase
MIHTSLSPNTERDDVILALKTLATPWTWGDFSAHRKLELAMAEVVGLPHVTLVDSGRTALATILRALGVGADSAAGDEVAVQAYTCVAVPGPVMWAGAKPVFVDCTDDLTMSLADLQKKVTAKTRAIVVQHTFGKQADIAGILQFARERNIVVIEDCAHSLGNKITADIAFFSFGRDKSISSVFGGAVVVRSPELHQKISGIVSGYKNPSTCWVVQQLMHPLVLAAAKSLYAFPTSRFSVGKIILEIAKRLHVVSKAVQKHELSGGVLISAFHQYSPVLARLALHQINKLERFTIHRRERAQEYAAALQSDGERGKELSLGGISAKILAPAFDPTHLYLRYTVTAQSREVAKEFFRKARVHGIQLGDWYTTPIAPRGVLYENIGYKVGSCPNAERLAQLTFNVPTHIGVTPAQVQKIISHVFS